MWLMDIDCETSVQRDGLCRKVRVMVFACCMVGRLRWGSGCCSAISNIWIAKHPYRWLCRTVCGTCKYFIRVVCRMRCFRLMTSELRNSLTKNHRSRGKPVRKSSFGVKSDGMNHWHSERRENLQGYVQCWVTLYVRGGYGRVPN